jgi:hypothetical protein
MTPLQYLGAKYDRPNL